MGVLDPLSNAVRVGASKRMTVGSQTKSSASVKNCHTDVTFILPFSF